MLMIVRSVISLQLELGCVPKTMWRGLRHVEAGIEASNWDELCTEVVGANTRGSETKVFSVD